MGYKWIGAVLVVAGCGGFGFSLARETLRQEALLRGLLTSLELMENEIRCRLTPLPQLCALAARGRNGALHAFFLSLGADLEKGTASQAQQCVSNILEQQKDLPVPVKRVLRQLGASLGRFDLEGQLKGLRACQTACRRELGELERNRELRLRSYRTLGLCAGAALAVLLI